MKKNISKGIVALFCLSGIYFLNTPDTTAINQLAFENIEALAQGEGPGENYRCYGDGSVDCHGYKVEHKISGFSLR